MDTPGGDLPPQLLVATSVMPNLTLPAALRTHAAVRCRRLRTRNLRCRARADPQYDVVSLGNLCVDAFLNVPECAAAEPDTANRLTFAMQSDVHLKDPSMLELLVEKQAQGVLDPVPLEAGGHCNFLIAASRLGLKAAAWGHIGADSNGTFLSDVLTSEGVTHLPMESGDDVDTTLTCYVLVDDKGEHRFCSRYDFGPWPLLPDPVEGDDKHTSGFGLCVNGFSFDELEGERVWKFARDVRETPDGFVLFDPGPRCKRFALPAGEDNDEQHVLGSWPSCVDILCVTREEGLQLLRERPSARAVASDDPLALAATLLLCEEDAVLQWVVVKLGDRGAVLVERNSRGDAGSGYLVYNGVDVGVHVSPAVQVPEVVDTVGCGDSFAAALALGYRRGWAADRALALAAAVGGATATRRGAGRNVADMKTVCTLLTEPRDYDAEESDPGELGAKVWVLNELSRQ